MRQPFSKWFERIEKWTGRLAKRPTAAMFLVGILAASIRLTILPLVPIPQPYIPDEFSQLLAGETFASGKLTNPTHPMWIHFETLHVDQKPGYMSMYPPVQGLVLAAGKVVFGHPWFGVCASVALMCSAIYWMLYTWLPPGWALLGRALVVLRIGIFSYWMNSYFGGAVSAAGGALILGALPRLMRRPRVSTTLILGIGLAILANSRPFEGLLLSIPVLTILLVWVLGRHRPSNRDLLWRMITPFSIILLITATAMAYYNWRVFGSPFTVPYQINRATYAVSPVLLWSSPQPEPPYHHAVMRDFFVSWELPIFQHARTIRGFVEGVAIKLGQVLFFYWKPALLIPLMMIHRTVRDRRLRPLIIIGAFFFLGSLANAFKVPHYLAPATGLIYAILLQCMRHLRLWRSEGDRVGMTLVRMAPLLCVLMGFIYVGLKAISPTTELPRTQVQHLLENLPGPQLAIVRYAPEHDSTEEWVYNAAKIDAAKVVWARAMTADEDRELTKYFEDRKVWLVEADRVPPKVTPYAP